MLRASDPIMTLHALQGTVQHLINARDNLRRVHKPAAVKALVQHDLACLLEVIDSGLLEILSSVVSPVWDDLPESIRGACRQAGLDDRGRLRDSRSKQEADAKEAVES